MNKEYTITRKGSNLPNSSILIFRTRLLTAFLFSHLISFFFHERTPGNRDSLMHRESLIRLTVKIAGGSH